ELGQARSRVERPRVRLDAVPPQVRREVEQARRRETRAGAEEEDGLGHSRSIVERMTLRSRDPEETLRLLLPHLERHGITRLANVTGLDRIGIPVYQAIRPNSRGLSLSQGKGVDEVSAQVSALMESLECHH